MAKPYTDGSMYLRSLGNLAILFLIEDRFKR